MAYYGIKESIGGRCITSNVEAEFWQGHAFACLIDPISSYAPKSEMHIFLFFEEVVQFLANGSSLEFQYHNLTN